MTDEQDLKPKKQKPIPAPVNQDSDIIWGAKKFAEGVDALTKAVTKPKNSAQAQAEHNAVLIERVKAEIAAKEKIKVQYEEYKALVDRLRALQAEEAASKPPAKKGIFSK